MALQLHHGADDWLRRESVADAPAGHRVGFRNRARDQHGRFRTGDRRHGVRFAVVEEMRIAFVGQKENPIFRRNVVKLFEFGVFHHRARRIAGRIDDHDVRLRRDVLLDHRGGQAKAFLLVGLDEHALAARIVHDVFVGHPVGHRDDDFIARIDQRLGVVEQHVLAAHRDDALGRLVIGAELGLVPVDDSLLRSRPFRPAGVYLVKFALMAAMPACLMLSGVGKSGSPALKSTTSTPSRRSLSASAMTFMVEETLIAEMRSAVYGWSVAG